MSFLQRLANRFQRKPADAGSGADNSMLGDTVSQDMYALDASLTVQGAPDAMPGRDGGAAVDHDMVALPLLGRAPAARHQRTLSTLLGVSVLALVLAVQTLLNLGGVTKAIPLTGITLPFISHGGASLLTTFTAVGLLLAISDGRPGAGRRPARTVKRAPAADATPSAPVPAPRPVDRPARPRRRQAAAKTP